MTELMQLNREWSSRPAEERFLDLHAMSKTMHGIKNTSQSKVMKLTDLSAQPCVDDPLTGLELVGPSGNPAGITNWAFSQLCMKAEIPAGYIASLPANLASQNINHALAHTDNQNVQLLVTRYEEEQNKGLGIRAITGENYTRINNASVVDELIKYVGNGVDDTNWTIPGEFGKQVPITLDNTTLYGGDRDMLVCLVDEQNRVTLPNRRNGEEGTLARGFMIWNSEVGSRTFGIRTFLFDFICSNRIIWGAQNVVTFKRRHTKNVLDVWQDGYKQLEAYSNAKASEEQGKLLEAVSYRIVDIGKTITNESATDAAKRRSEEATKFLTAKLALPVVPRKLVDGIKASFLKAEQRPIETLWDCVTGVTEHAKTIEFQDDRMKLETAGGKLMELVG